MDRGKKGKAEFFGFPLTKAGAQIVYILGVLLLIGTSLSFFWLIYSFLIMSSAYTAWGIESSYYAGSYMTYMIPWIVIEVAMMILAIYMIRCGKKGM